MFDSFFITGPLPAIVETGHYQFPLVVLSYAVASFAAFTALSLAQQLVNARSALEKRWLHLGGAVAMGIGIWSMHFIGMLSYKMRMALDYDWWLTLLSMIIAIAVAYGALAIVARERLSFWQILLGGMVLGLGICGMHYTGMAAMEMDADLRYIPVIFILSVLIAMIASAAALWLAFTLARTDTPWRYLFQVIAALVMGAAICGMHYTGMAAAVFIPYADCRYAPDQDFDMLVLAIFGITALLLSIALGLGIYRKTQTELALRGSEAKLRTIIDGALDAVIVMNRQGDITEWNRQAEAVFGWTHEEAVGKRLAGLIIPPGFRQAHEEGLRRFFKDGIGPILGKRIEVPALHRQGKEFPVELTVTVQKLRNDYHFTAFVRDISERKKAEERIGLLAAIVASSDDAIVSTTLDGAITSWNAGAERLFGHTAAEAVGRPIQLIIPPDRQGEEKYIFDLLRADRSIEHYETIRMAKGGQRVNVSLTISPIHNAAGAVTGASMIARDITERKEAEAQRKRYMRDLERSNQELDDFAYIASHDLKEPLRGLYNHASFLIEDFGDKLGEDGTHRLRRLSALSQRMERLVSDLLYFSRLGRSDMAIQSVDLNEIVSELEQMLETFLKERSAVISVPRALPKVVCDKPRVTEVFQNLIVNAVKYNDKPKRWVEVGFRERVETGQGREYNVFYVRDDGVGIAPEFHQEVFRIFRRLQRNADEGETGTGVGLTFVKKIIERHGGRIWLESTPGEGTTFYFTLSGGKP